MNITRFDTIEYDVLQCGVSGGYYPVDSERGQRAIVLMEEGIFNNNPPQEWHKNGYKGFTESGKLYYKAFMEKVRESHGHEWETHYDSDPDIYDNDERGNQINIFAYSSGYHNGPQCKNCGFSFCHHCENEMEIPHCSMRNKE